MRTPSYLGSTVYLAGRHVNRITLVLGAREKRRSAWYTLFAHAFNLPNVKKSRRAFFHFGSIGVFQGDISAISSRSVVCDTHTVV